MTNFFKVGGAGSMNKDDSIVLLASISTSLNVCTFQRWGNGGGAYKVADGKNFYISKIRHYAQSGAAYSMMFAMGYADNDVGQNTTTARTNPVNIIGKPETVDVSAFDTGLRVNGGSQAWAEMDKVALGDMIFKAVPSSTPGKYLYLRCAQSGATYTQYIITGFEAA